MNSSMRDVILNTQVPLVLKDFPLDWECFDGSLISWCNKYDKAVSKLPTFEGMRIADCDSPQWERKRKMTEMTMGQFLEKHTAEDQADPAEWSAYQYVRAAQLPTTCIKGVNFQRFGFEDRNDFSLWLGSRYSNTPCHYDTYGINIVVQVYGSKSWLLFPPETQLQSTRIPYEESSVYSQENFFAPAPNRLHHYEQFHEQAYHCILQPGDVLIVPRHWWHYVETVETSLSVNYWIPLKTDLDFTLDELIVKHIIESFVKGESDQVKQYILNPNQLDEICDKASILFAQFEQAVHNQSLDKRQLWDTDYMSQREVTQSLSLIPVNIRAVEKMSKDSYLQMIERNSRRHKMEPPSGNMESAVISPTLELLINSMCAPCTIGTIKRELFQRLENVT